MRNSGEIRFVLRVEMRISVEMKFFAVGHYFEYSKTFLESFSKLLIE